MGPVATAPVAAPSRRPAASASVRTTVLAGVGLAIGLVVLAAMAFPGHPEWFVKFGGQGHYTPYAQQVLGEDLLVPLDDGHDGQGYWLQARDPALLDGSREATIFDRPAYRAQRMLYPTLAAPFGLAGEQGVLWGLVAVNVAAIGLGTFLAARLAVAAGATPIVGLAYTLNPLVAISLLMDFGDALALTALVAVVLAIRERRLGWAVLAAVAAVLAKEVMLLPLVAVALTGVGGLAWRHRVRLVVVPGVTAAVWALYVRWRLGWPQSQVQEFSFVPLWGYVDSYRRGWSHAGNWSDAGVAVVLLALAAVIVVRWWRRRTLELTVALPFALLVPFLSAYVVDLGLNSIRALGPALTFLAIDWYADPARRPTASAGARSPEPVNP